MMELPEKTIVDMKLFLVSHLYRIEEFVNVSTSTPLIDLCDMCMVFWCNRMKVMLVNSEGTWFGVV